jgi:hypothetical protein
MSARWCQVVLANFLIAHEPTATTMIAPITAPTIPPQSNLSSSPMPKMPVKIP